LALETALTSRRDNTEAIHQHKLHTFQTTHSQHDYVHCFALVTFSC